MKKEPPVHKRPGTLQPWAVRYAPKGTTHQYIQCTGQAEDGDWQASNDWDAVTCKDCLQSKPKGTK